MERFLRFFTNMDARALRAVSISVGLFLGVALIVVMGKTTAIFDDDDAPWIRWLQARAESPWALPATIAVFAAASFLGAPQFVLIAAAVVALGPTRGFFYAWLATMVSAGLNFQVGRAFGADVLRRYGGAVVNRASRFVGRNGFMAALLVRIVPSAPFVVVNMAAGVSHMRPLAFLAGTGLGIIPKTAFVAFAGHGLVELVSGDWRMAALLALGAGLWLAAMLIVRRMLSERVAAEPEPPPVPPPAPEPPAR